MPVSLIAGYNRCSAFTLKKEVLMTALAKQTGPVRVHETLGDAFYDVVTPAAFPQHILRYRNDRAAGIIGLERLSDDEWIDHFGRFKPIEGSFPHPLALRYHGHQFGHYNPELGDGRGFLFAQFYAPHEQVGSQPDSDQKDSNTLRLLDLGTKGSGQTPYSRTADGRLTLKGAVREVLATELLDALSVDTSHSLSVIETGEALSRHDEPSPTRSAVLVRLLHSHIRIGSFQRLAYLKQRAELEQLTRYTIRHYYSDIDPEQPYPQLIPALITGLGQRVAQMVAGWMAAGFVHGVLNTDNFNITGESFDYGPWRFLPYFDPTFTAAYFDQTSRYAFGRQPQAAMWALCRLADCFTEEVEITALEESLSGFYPALEEILAQKLLYRLGLKGTDAQASAFSQQLFKAASATHIPYAKLFHDLYGGKVVAADADPRWNTDSALIELKQNAASFTPRQTEAQIRAVRQMPVIGMEIEQVEAIWAPIAQSDDWTLFHQTISEIRKLSENLRA